MHRAFFVLSLLAMISASPEAFAIETAAPQQDNIKGLWLTTEYPSIVARAGETTTIKMKLQNYDLPPQPVALSIEGAPADWKTILLGGNMPVSAAMPATNGSVPLTLRVDVPANTQAGTEHLIVHAQSGNARSDLPIDITTGQELASQLSIKTALPSLNGTPTTSFDYQFTVSNEGDKNLVVKLAAQAPPNFQMVFTEAYGNQELSSVPIDAGKNKELTVKVTPPADVTAGDYAVSVRASAEGTAADAKMQMIISGVPKLTLASADERLNTYAEAGKVTPIKLVVQNTGSAPASDVEMSASPPTGWKVTFQPDKISAVAPNQKRDVEALLVPSAQAIAGDYMTTFSANATGDVSSADFRITVGTSTLWGIVGIGIIATAVLMLVGAVVRFGRR